MFIYQSILRPLRARFTTDQIAIKELSREFAKKEIIPNAVHHDSTGEYPTDIISKAWKLGLMNLHIPKECGGPGMGLLDSCIISEELAYGCTGIQTAIEANNLAEGPVILGGSKELKERYLSRMTKEPLMASYCVTEPHAGSDVSAIKTTASKKGDMWIINGQKMWITNAGKANWFFVLAKTDESHNNGFTGFVVEANSAGLTLGKKEQNLGQRASDTRAVFFDNVEVSDKNRVGKVGEGFYLAMKAFDMTRPLIGAAAVGLSKRALEESISYATQRKSMGSIIADHQAVAFILADMAMKTEASRLLVHKSASLYDKGEKNTLHASYAKLFAAETANFCATNAIQIHGGNGYNREYPVEKLFRDAKIYEIYEGTSQIQRLIISRQILRQHETE